MNPGKNIRLKTFFIVWIACAGIFSSRVSMGQEAVPALQQQQIMLDVLDLKGMDVLDVVKLISQKSGVNIVATQNVKGRVTVYLKNVDVREALTIIAEAYGWAFHQDGDVIKVMTDQEYESKYGQRFGYDIASDIKQLTHARASDIVGVLTQIKSTNGKIIPDEKTNTIVLIDSPRKIEEMGKIIKQLDLPSKSEVFHLSYAKAEEISGKITETLTPTVGRMKFDERSNKVFVTDTPVKIEEIRKMIEAFDQKDTEVLIEAKILQIVLNDDHKLGIDWEALVSDYHALSLKSDFDILGETEKRGQVSVGTLSADDYTATIQALDTVGVTDILSSPRITAVNNKEAKILVGSTEPYVTTTTTTPSSGPTTTAESVNFIEVGVKLFVTPTIHNDGFITMKIKPEVSSVVGSLQTGNNNTIPIVETSEAETTVIVKDNVTIVIGGLIKEEKLSTTKKIPYLGNIPILGFPFRSVDQSVEKTEIVIFLTPRIITGDADVVAEAPALSLPSL